MSPRVTVAVLSLAAVSAIVGPVRADGPSVLRLVWFDPSGLAWGTESAARTEATALLTRMGATVSWRSTTSPEEIKRDEVWVTLVGGGPRPASGPLVLGATSRKHEVASVVWVRVPNVCAAVGISSSRTIATLTHFERRAVGVALGRVIAHEVVHARVPSLSHGSGLMSRRLNHYQLTVGSIAFEPEVAFALQAALRGEPVFAPPAAGVLAADARVPEQDRWDR